MTSGDPGAVFPRGLALLVAGALFMEILDATIIATAIPSIASSFGVQAVDVNVAISAYVLTMAVLIPVSGAMADRFGVRRIFLVAITVFTLGSIGCALSASLPMLVGMRVLQSVGGAMMVPVGRLAVLQQTGKAQLVNAIAYLTWPALSAPVLAPALGGAIATYASWRWIFVINVPLGIVGVAAGFVLLRGADRLSNARDGTRRPLDVLGFVGLAIGITALVVSLDHVRVDGTQWWAVGGGCAFAAGALGLCARHLRRTEHPLLDLSVLRIATFRTSVGYGSCYRMVITAVPFLLPLMFQLRFGWTPFEAGLMVIALFAGNLAVKPSTTAVMRRWGIRYVLVGVPLASAAVFGVLAAIGTQTHPAVIAAVLVVSGALRSLGFTAYNTLAFADVDGGNVSRANTVHATAQELFAGLGIALGAVALTVFGGLLTGLDQTPAGAFSWTFVLLAVLMAGTVIGALRLPHDAGVHVTGTRG